MSFLKLRTHIVAFDVNPVKDGRFWGCSRIGEWEQKAPLHRFSHTYPTMMKLGTVVPYIKKIQKDIWITWHTLWVLLTSAFFHWKSANFAISANASYRLCMIISYDSFNFFNLINMVTILMMSAKMATLGLLIIKIF